MTRPADKPPLQPVTGESPATERTTTPYPPNVPRAVELLHAAMTEINEDRGECSASAWGTLLAVHDLLTGDPDA